jgi:acid phosphatase
MKQNRRAQFFATAAVGAVFGLGLMSSNLVSAFASPQGGGNPQEPELYANLYMQTSAEYRAVCIQTYALAAERLQQKLAVPRLDGNPPAVVMDLDETVLDNGGYESFLDRNKLAYSQPAWDRWERDFASEVRLIPGAKGFIDWAESKGVSVVYISNRADANRAGTIAALRNVGLSVDGIDKRLMLKTNNSDKTARRRLAEQDYRVLMYFGDNLRDFDERFVVPKLDPKDAAGQDRAIADRLAKVDASAYRFGGDWIILPNPVYGEWTAPLGSDPHSKLRPTNLKP